MDNAKLLLLAELPGLEAAKQAIEFRIAQIQHEVSGTQEASKAPMLLKPLPINDPSVLGRDSIGRIKRKRNISPELREQKRLLIAAAREKKLKALADAKQDESKRPSNTSSVEAPVLAKAAGSKSSKR